MRFRFFLMLAILPLILAACATHQKTPGATFDRIGQEMQGALTANPNRTLFGLNRGGQRVECLFQAPGNFGCRPAA